MNEYMMDDLKPYKGFTLIELIIVIVIISILASIVIPKMGELRTKAKGYVENQMDDSEVTAIELEKWNIPDEEDIYVILNDSYYSFYLKTDEGTRLNKTHYGDTVFEDCSDLGIPTATKKKLTWYLRVPKKSILYERSQK